MAVPRSSPDISAGICEFVRNSYRAARQQSGRGHRRKKKKQKFAFKEKSGSERQCPYWQCCPERVRLGLSAFEGSASHFHSELVPLTQRSHPGLSKQSQLAAEMSLVLALPKLV